MLRGENDSPLPKVPSVNGELKRTASPVTTLLRKESSQEQCFATGELLGTSFYKLSNLMINSSFGCSRARG